MSNKFNWSNFEVGFLKSILNSEKTKESLRPTFDTDEARPRVDVAGMQNK